MITKFCSKNYYKMNLKFGPRMLKIVHILNLDNLFEEMIADRISCIGKELEIQAFVYYYRTYNYDLFLDSVRKTNTEANILIKLV